MHLFLTLVAGVALLALFLLFGLLWDGTQAGLVAAARIFLPVWLVLSVVNLWVGVARAGYSVNEELPILGIVFCVPAVLAAAAIWHLSRGPIA